MERITAGKAIAGVATAMVLLAACGNGDPEVGVSNDPEDVIIPIEDGWVDLVPAIEDNILLNIPTQILSEEERQSSDMPQGSNWSVVTEDGLEKQRAKEKEEQIDPRFAGLKALLQDEENLD